jgi:hypothetical protein
LIPLYDDQETYIVRKLSFYYTKQFKAKMVSKLDDGDKEPTLRGFYTRDELLAEDCYQMVQTCKRVKYYAAGAFKEPIDRALAESGLNRIIEVLDHEGSKMTFEKARILSRDQELCAVFMKSLRTVNQPYYSFNFWRLFTPCIDPSLMDVTLGYGHRINLDDPIPYEYTSPEVLELYLEDNWWLLFKSEGFRSDEVHTLKLK